MDFLDPRRRRSHRRRLFIGYALMSIVIAISTMIILYLAYGYDIDRETGDLIQNGIVFVDSKPNGADIYVNDVRQGTRTGTRMVLPAGNYTVRLEGEGYRHWERTFHLSGGEIQRLVYPFLVPNVLNTSDIATYDSLPALATQSPDRRWVLVQKPGQTYQFDLFDLNNETVPPVVVTIPPASLTTPAAEAKLEFMEWSTNNRHVLVKRTFNKAAEYIMFDRENPTESVNVNRTLGITPQHITLRDKKHDQFYYLDAVPGTLRSAHTGNRTLSAPLATGVINYKSYADNIILFATQEEVAAGKTEFKVLENDRTYSLKTVNQSDNYVLDVSRYDGEWYYAVGSSGDNTVFVYENPLPAIKRETRTPLIVAAILRLQNPRFISFSANTQFIGLQSGNQFLTLDLEDRDQYRISLKHEIPIGYKIPWMDGHRFLYSVNNQSYIIDFDGSNEETLVTSELMPGPFFGRDFDDVFTLEDSKSSTGKKALTRTIIEE